LLFLSTIIDFFIGIALDSTEEEKKRKKLLTLSIIASLSILGFFKYFNFFSESFAGLINTVGLKADAITLKIILPIGISFYIFQTMSYTIDVYRKKIKASKNFFDFALFVSFFPQLVAGPIERAVNLLPQIQKPRIIQKEQIYAAFFLIIWGYLKKVVLADNIGLISDRIFNNYANFQGFDLFLGTIAFAVQIYCDFSAYSDIARGISKLMGFELMINFKLPYFALNPKDFWNRWHISLSSWLKDYLYIPLGGNRKGTKNTYSNLFLTMVIGGLWHGAAWNFILWGFFHGIILILYKILEKGNEYLNPWNKENNYFLVFLKIALMLFLTLFGWMIFRSTSLSEIIYFIKNTGFSFSETSFSFIKAIGFYFLPLAIIQFLQYFKKDLLFITKLPVASVAVVYTIMLIWIIVFHSGNSIEFIYFQF
jgi:D-alanyl-lipoteichoic acid acyltransferase DltB (MBOAT superfamily)